MANQEDWLLKVYDQLTESNYWGSWRVEFKDGKITLMRFERTELPPKEFETTE